MKRTRWIWIVLASVAALAAAGHYGGLDHWAAVRIWGDAELSAPATRPASWAQPVDVAGVGNCYRLADGLYRGAQPDGAGFENLRKIGVKSVVNLRFDHSDQDKIGATQLEYLHIPMIAFSRPTDEQVVEFLRFVTDKGHQPVFVHCQHGSERTGMMCAIYRIAVCGWPREEAIREMKAGGFGYHPECETLVEYIRRDLSVDELKLRTSIP